MVRPLRALNAQWAIIAPRAPIYKISTPVQQGLLIPIQEWAAVKTVYPAFQVPFYKWLNSYQVISQCYASLILRGWCCPISSNHLSHTIFIHSPLCFQHLSKLGWEMSHKLSTRQVSFASLLDRVMYLDRVQLDTFVSLELCPPHLWMEERVVDVLKDTSVP